MFGLRHEDAKRKYGEARKQGHGIEANVRVQRMAADADLVAQGAEIYRCAGRSKDVHFGRERGES